MGESLQIRRFSEIPSPEEFASQIERKNIPAVFTGCLKDWKAFSKWNASNGGLDYLELNCCLRCDRVDKVPRSSTLPSFWDNSLSKAMELVGSSVVEAMVSRSAPVFYGDIRSHERVSLPFSTFIGYCKDLLQLEDDSQDSVSQLRKHEPAELTTQHGDFVGEESPHQIYLAQVVPIVNAENKEKGQLECLKDDIKTPAFLGGKLLASVNLWMNSARTRSSAHYDPHHNLLCIIAGCKQVVLWPPSSCPFLYPLPVYGEASNHSAIPLENRNFSLYPRARSIEEHSQKVTLHAGDSLFIPEGWFHQVDSEDLTIAVNFWWQSDMISGMIEHMDGYYLRRIMKRNGQNRMLSTPSMTMVNSVTGAPGQFSNGDAGCCDEDLDLNNQKAGGKGKPEQEFSLHELQPHELRSLHELVSFVHQCVNQNQLAGNISADQSVSGEEDKVKKIVKTNLFNLEEDPIANIVWNLEPHAFRSVFLTLAHNFPRTLEALVLHALSPVVAEVLTRKFEQMDQIVGPDDRSQFYQKFYSVFDDQYSAMDAFLNGKESFACQAFNNVLAQFLGINIDGS